MTKGLGRLFIVISTLTFSLVTRADLPSNLHMDRDGLIVNANGAPVPVYLSHIADYCQKGFHVPTIRELAVASKSKGAEILEVSAVSPGKVPAGFDLVDAIDQGGTADRFYYKDLTTMSSPPKCYGDMFWSSSALSWAEGFNYTMSRSCGQAHWNNDYDQMFLRCLADRP